MIILNKFVLDSALTKSKRLHRRGMFDDDTYKLITERFDLAVSGITRK